MNKNAKISVILQIYNDMQKNFSVIYLNKRLFMRQS